MQSDVAAQDTPLKTPVLLFIDLQEPCAGLPNCREPPVNVSSASPPPLIWAPICDAVSFVHSCSDDDAPLSVPANDPVTDAVPAEPGKSKPRFPPHCADWE